MLLSSYISSLCSVQEAAKDAEFRERLNEQLAEMQLAVEEQELQKAAAVKQGEVTADEIQQQCTSLLEVFSWQWFIVQPHIIFTFITFTLLLLLDVIEFQLLR